MYGRAMNARLFRQLRYCHSTIEQGADALSQYIDVA